MRYSVLFSTLAWLVVSTANAQVEIVYPTNNQRAVERAPAITIRAPAPIIQSSVTRMYPDADAMGMIANRPTVLITDTSFDSLPLQQRIRASASGTYSFLDPQTLVFTPRHLIPGKTYRVSVDGLWVQGAHPILTQSVESVFSVAPSTPKLSFCSLTQTTQISCREPIRLEFTEALEGGLGDVGRIITLERAGTTTNGAWVPTEYVPSLNGTTLSITPVTQWAPSDLLRVKVALSAITGNPLDDNIYSTTVRQVMNVHVEAVAQDGRTVPDNIREQVEQLTKVVRIGDTLALVADEVFEDRWRLIGWNCDIQTLPPGTNSIFTADCDIIGNDVFIRAVVGRLDTIRIAVHTDSTGAVLVYDKDNVLVQTITGDDTVTIDDGLPSCRLVANPANGYVFNQWQSSGFTLSNQTSPVVVLNGSGKPWKPYVNNQPAYSVSTTFNLNPNNGIEVYSLRGDIYDTEKSEGWLAEEAIEFTTDDNFQGVVSIKQTICARASDCWEITGYMTSATGKSELYDEPLQEACVSDFMMNPENVITFFVRRKLIQLRVEKVLMATDDPDNLMAPDKLASKANTIVELRTTSGTRTVWKRLSDQTCYDGQVKFARYRLQCGDVVRITPTNADMQCQKFKYFAALQSYVLPTADDPNVATPTYTVVMDDDFADFDATDCDKRPLYIPELRVRACFRQGFGVESIGFSVRVTKNKDRSDSRFEDRWYDAASYRTANSDEPTGGHHLEYIPREGTLIKIRFTLPVDQRTITAGGIEISSYGNTLYSDPTETDLDFETTSNDENVTFESEPYESARTVVLSIKDPETAPLLQALHGGTVSLVCQTSIKSLNGQPLEAQRLFLCQTIEPPAYSLQLHDIEFEYDGDADFIFDNDGEVYHATYGGDVAKTQILGKDQGFSRIPDCSEQQGVPPGECTLPHSDKDGPQGYGDMLLWIQPYWMDINDIAWWHTATYDEDCKDNDDCFVNRVDDLLDIAQERANKIISEETGSNLFGELAELGVNFVRALLPVDDQDRNIGYGTLIATGADKWGARRTTRYYEIGNENATYRLIPRLLVSRGVVR